MNPPDEPPQVVEKNFLATSTYNFRLVPAAVVLWTTTACAVLWGWVWALIGGVLVISLTFLLWRGKGKKEGVRSVVFSLLGVGIVLCGPLVFQLSSFSRDALREHANRGDEVVFRAVITERPRPIHSAGYANRAGGTQTVAIKAEVMEARVKGESINSTGTIVLLADYASWSRLLPGQQVNGQGKAASPSGNDLTLAVIFVRGPPTQISGASWWQSLADSVRTDLRKTSSVLPEDSAGLFPGLIVGDTGALSPVVEQQFTDAGLSHLLAVSGSNLVIVCGAALLLLRLFRLGPKLSSVVAGLVLLGFVILVGPDPSVLRAGVMAAIGLFALMVGRKSSALSALALTICVLVTLDPAISVSLGFILSALATAGLILISPLWTDFLIRRGVPSGLAEVLSVSSAAFLVTLPVIVGISGQVSVIAVVANIAATGVVAPLTVLGVLVALFSPWWPWAAEVLTRLAEPGLNWLIFLARHAVEIPGAVLPWPSGLWGVLLILAVIAGSFFLLRVRFLRIALAVLLVCLLLIVVPIRVISPPWPPPGWVAVSCDVGQGDAMVLSISEPGRAVVIDTGPEPGPVDECLDRLGVDRIPLLVLSHLHADHIGGLSSVLEGRSVGAIAVGPGRAPGWAWRQVTELAARRRIPLLELEVGQQLRWPGLSMEVLGPQYIPPENDSSTNADGTDINNSSVVLRADTRAGRILATGDVELAAQSDLLAEHVDLHADILKVPHHGSRYSLPQFLAAVAPRLALISVGVNNSYGHPNKTTMDNLKSLGALIARTDQDGDSAVLADATGPLVVRRGKSRSPPARVR
jgi:competence protein ComEC